MVTGPRKAKRGNKRNWGQKQLSKKIKKALDWKGDQAKTFLKHLMPCYATLSQYNLNPPKRFH